MRWDTNVIVVKSLGPNQEQIRTQIQKAGHKTIQNLPLEKKHENMENGQKMRTDISIIYMRKRRKDNEA